MIQPDEVFDFESFQRSVDTASAEWEVPHDCPYLDGHFPGNPVLPAVGLLDGSIELLRRFGAEFLPGRLSLKKAKFSGMIVPGMRVKVFLAVKENRFDIDWRKSENLEPLATFSFRI